MNVRRTFKWMRRIIVVFFATALLAVGGVLIFIHTDFGRDYVRRKAEHALLNSFPGGAHIGRISGSPFGTLVIDDLRLNGVDGKPMIIVGTARVKIEILPLLGHIARIDRLDLEDVTFDKHPQPELPPEIPETPKEGGNAWSVEIPRASVLRGRVVVANAEKRLVEITDLDAQASITVDDSITIEAHALGQTLGAPVEATTLMNIRDGVLAFPLAVAKIADANVLALALYSGPRVDGVVRANISVQTAQKLAGVTLPGDVAVVATAIAGNVDAKVEVAGATVRALLDTNLAAKSAKGLVIADVPDATRLDPRFGGNGVVTASIDASVDHVRGIVTLDGVARVDKATVGKDHIGNKTLVAIDGSLAGAWIFLESAADLGKARATAIAEIARQNDEYVLTKSTFLAAAKKVGAARTDLAIGSFTTSLRATGRVWPKPEVVITGNVGGDALRFGKLSVTTIDAAIKVGKQASGHLDLGGVRNGPTLLGSLSLDAHGSLERTEAGPIVTIDVDDHSITTAANGTWGGAGGHIVIDPLKITVERFHTGNGDGKVTADVTFTKASKDLRAKVDAKNVQLATLAPALKGTVAANLDVTRRGGRWAGKGHIVAAKLTIPNQPVVDIDSDIKITGRRVELDATTVAEAGAISLAIDVTGPYDLTDVNAWKRLDRRAINLAGVGVSKVDLAKLGKPSLSGIVDGKLGITDTDASGDLHVSDIVSSAGTFDGDLTLKPNDTHIDAGILARLDGTELVSGTATIALPTHPFDPASWRALGKRVLKSADIVGKPINVDPALLAKFHLDKPYRARVESRIVADEGADSITVTADIHQLSGGIIKQPIDVHAETTLDAKGLSVTGDVKVQNTELVKLDASAPVTLDQLVISKEAKITGRIELPNTPAKDLVAVIGRGDVTNGQVAGSIEIGGSVGMPTATVDLHAKDVEIPATLAGRKPAILKELAIVGSWDGQIADLTVTGSEAGGNKLEIKAHGDPRKRETLTASVNAKKFDLAPVTAFLTGAMSAARGTITADLTLQGLDKDVGDVHGSLSLENGRMPLSPLLGTLRSINAEVTVGNHIVKLTKLDAKLGKGEVHATGNLDLQGSTPTKMHADATITNVSLIRAFQPTISSQIRVDLENKGVQWGGDIDVSKAHVEIVSAGGVKLLDSETPSDIVFVDEAPKDTFKLGARLPPSRPWLIADVKIHTTTLDIIQEQFQIRGTAQGDLSLSLGQGSVGLDGTLYANRGDIDLLGTRSQLERGEVTFDGTVDPLLNIRVVRELDTMSVTAQVSGRASKPEITMSSDAGSYTQGELYSFFIGGQGTGSDAAQAGQAAGYGYLGNVVSSRFNNFLKDKLHIDVDVKVGYEVATATTSEAYTLGARLTKNLSAYTKRHPQARIDENGNEALFEYQLPRNLLLRGDYGDRGYGGADLLRRWHWN